MQEASGALLTAESQASQKQQELLDMQRKCEANIQSAVGKATVQYQEQLSSATQSLQAKDQAVQKWQDQVWTLELSLASQANLPSVVQSQEEGDLCKEVFDYVPGTVNTRWGAATYQSRDQPFQFQKQVWFGDRSLVPDLKSSTDPKDPTNSSHAIPFSSTPFPDTKPINKTFDVSQISPLTNNHQDVATIAAEVSAGAAAQASKEFCCMHEPKIMKFKGGYSADAELLFRSWHMDILSNIQDCELDNKAAIQLIKDMTAESAHHQVEFQLDLCGSEISYQDLLKHLSVTFQGGKDEANLLAGFYSCVQKAKETEEAFADELQILACKVISKKPDFLHDLDMTLKQCYASQLYDRNSTSIAKTLLMQMPQMFFTQFCNELAQVLGTNQCTGNKASAKTVTAWEAEPEEKSPLQKSKRKQNAKISVQSSQIKDLHTKLDQAVAKNSQIREFLSPTALQQAFTTALQTTQAGSNNSINKRGTGKKFLGKCREPQLSAGKDGTTDPEKSCRYCKDTGHELKNCPRLAARNEYLAAQQQQ